MEPVSKIWTIVYKQVVLLQKVASLDIAKIIGKAFGEDVAV